MLEVSYQRVAFDSPYFTQLVKLLQSEWSDYKVEHDNSLPQPIAAIVDEEVVGGLAYTRYAEPNSEKVVVWVNAVYVSEEWRRRGLAHKLIWLGRQQVKGQEKLYALTDIPNLYESLGWIREGSGDQLENVVVCCPLE